MSSPPTMPEPGDAVVRDVDADVDAEMEDAQDPTTTTNNNNNNIAATSAPRNPNEAVVDSEFTQPETQPTTTSGLAHQNRKDVTLREFLSKMDDYAPIIPDAVTAHYLTLSGLPPPSPADPTGASTNTTPLPLARLLALATQKFVADIAADAYQYSRIRASNSASSGNPGVGGGGAGPSGVGGAGAGGVSAMNKAQQGGQLGVQRTGFGGGGTGGSGQGRTVLTMEDLGMAVQDYGINLKRGEFYR